MALFPFSLLSFFQFRLSAILSIISQVIHGFFVLFCFILPTCSSALTNIICFMLFQFLLLSSICQVFFIFSLSCIACLNLYPLSPSQFYRFHRGKLLPPLTLFNFMFSIIATRLRSESMSAPGYAINFFILFLYLWLVRRQSSWYISVSPGFT